MASRVARLGEMGFEDRAAGLLGGTNRVHDFAIEFILAAKRSMSFTGMQRFIRPVGLELSRLHVVLQIRSENVQQTLAERGRFHGDEQFDATIEIARHPIGAR